MNASVSLTMRSLKWLAPFLGFANRSLQGGRAARHAHRQASFRRGPGRLVFEPLEARKLLSVDLLGGFAGMEFSTAFEDIANPPDAPLAAGPNHLVEAVNHRLAFFNKANGQEIFEQRFSDFFASVGAVPSNSPGGILTGFDPRVSYDELAGRFVVFALEQDSNLRTSHALVAVSDDANPVGNWEMHRINVEEADTYFWDYTGLGWDADAIYLTGNMVPWSGKEKDIRAGVLTIDKASVLDGNNDTITCYQVDLPGLFVVQPAVMHGAKPGDPMYFAASWRSDKGGGWNHGDVEILRMTDKLSAAPTFTEYDIPVAKFATPPDPTQPEPGQPFYTDETMSSVAWRDNHLVAAQTVGTDKVARARWYEFDTSAAVPALTQFGEVDPGAGIHTWCPSIDIAPNGDLGMTYLQSSADAGDANGDGLADGFLSMYVTGRRASDRLGALQTPVLVKAGEAIFSYSIATPPIDFAPYRSGDHGGLCVDPVDGSFWAGHEYATDAVRPLDSNPAYPFGNWGTWIGHFVITGAGAVFAEHRECGVLCSKSPPAGISAAAPGTAPASKESDNLPAIDAVHVKLVETIERRKGVEKPPVTIVIGPILDDPLALL